MCVNSFHAEIRIFWENMIKTMAADALARSVAKMSTAMALKMHDEHKFTFLTYIYI